MEKVWYKFYDELVPEEIDPDSYSSIVEIFEKSIFKYRDKKAIRNFGKALSFSQLEEKSRHFASYLQNCKGMKKGDRLAIMLPNTLQYFVVLFGALRAGLIVVNLNPLYTKRELVKQLCDSGAEGIVVLANVAHTLEKALSEVPLKHVIITELGDLFGFPKKQIVNFTIKYVKWMVSPFFIPQAVTFGEALKQGKKQSFQHVEVYPEDIAFLQYTGGTTGNFKGAILTHRNMIANMLQTRAWIANQLNPNDDVLLLPLPLYHIFSLTLGLSLMLIGGTETILVTNPRDIPHFVQELKQKITIMTSINTLCNALLHNEEFLKLDFSHLRFTFAGGMACTREVAAKWKKVTGVPLIEGYGLTEASPIIAANLASEKEFTGGIGFPFPSTEVEIQDENGNPVEHGTIGELCARGPQVMREYWNNPEETKRILDPRGWLHTGDMAMMDERGFLKMVDRKKDMIIVSGFNVYPSEVEDILMSHPGILEAAVIGVPRPDYGGEIVKAFVVKKDMNLKKEEIIAYCKEQLVPYKVPRQIEFLGVLPKSPVGKILRRLLREEDSE